MDGADAIHIHEISNRLSADDAERLRQFLHLVLTAPPEPPEPPEPPRKRRDDGWGNIEIIFLVIIIAIASLYLVWLLREIARQP